MDSISAVIASLDPAIVAAIQAVFLVTVLDFVLGTLHALTPPSTFKLSWLDAWVGDHVLKAVTIVLALIFGGLVPPITVGEFSFSIVTTTALAAAATYVATVGGSAILNLNFRAPDAPPKSVQ